MERRNKRSDDTFEALQYLAEAIADRNEVKAIAFIGSDGRVMAGTGTANDLSGLRTIAIPASRGEPCDAFDQVTAGTDFMLHAVVHERGTMYLAALGSRIRQMRDAAFAVRRILTPESVAA